MANTQYNNKAEISTQPDYTSTWHNMMAKRILHMKFLDHGKRCAIQRKWQNRKLQQEAHAILQASERRNMRQIRNYQKYTNKKKLRNASISKENGECTQNKTEVTRGYTEWITQQFQISPDKEIPQIVHISEKAWGTIAQHQRNADGNNAEDEMTPCIIHPEITHLWATSQLYSTSAK